MRRTLTGFVALFGAVCVLISLAHIAFGPGSIPGSIPGNAIMDSEDRFYAALFTGFGVALIWTSRDLKTRFAVFHALLATFFLGGLARIASVFATGWPGPLFTVLGSLELILPPLLWAWRRRAWPL